MVCRRKWLSLAVIVCALGEQITPALAIQATSLSQLRSLSGLDNVTVTMKPGTYSITPNGSNRNFVEFTGENSTFDLSGATFTVDTRLFAGFGGGVSNIVNVFALEGNYLTLTGLDIEGVDVDVAGDPDAQRWADSGANYVRISGTGNALEDARVVTRGSNPYGFGDAFGKGGRPSNGNDPPEEGGVPFISHQKTSGIWVRESTDVTIDGLDLQMHTFGHGVYLQAAEGSNNIRNSTVVGELFSSNDIINHALYQEYGVNVYGQTMEGDYEGIMLSGSEDGIRSYGAIQVNGQDVFTEDIHVENVRVENMRIGYALYDAIGSTSVVNSKSIGNEVGFRPDSGSIITGITANVTNGPAIYYSHNNINDTQVEITLVDDAPQPGRDWEVAVITGSNNDVTIIDGGITPGVLSSNTKVRIGQAFNDWRHAQSDVDDGRFTSNLSIINGSGQTMVLGSDSLTGDDYNVTSGNVLGGAGVIEMYVTNQNSDINFEVGSMLDPTGSLAFDVGEGEVQLHPAISGNNTQALHFTLGDVSDSDHVEVLGSTDLDIGNGVLEFDDFVFTTTAGFSGGLFTLFSSDHPITGNLGSTLTGVVEGSNAELLMSPDGQTIQLMVDSLTTPGDFDADGDVDGSDFLLWQRNSLSAVALQDWQQNYGLPNSLSSIRTVPEPSTAFLLILAVGCVAQTLRNGIAGPSGMRRQNGFV